MVKRASKKLWILRRLNGLGAQRQKIIDMYIKHCRSILEYAVPVWQASITVERLNLEGVQKVALHNILGDSYQNYQNPLQITGLDTLESKRRKMCLKFARKVESNITSTQNGSK